MHARRQLGDAAPQHGVFRDYFRQVVADLEPLERVDPGLIFWRRDIVSRAQLVDVLGEILDELRYVIEQQWPLEVPGGPHLADLRFPVREDLLPVLAEEIGEPPRLVAGEQVGHASKLRRGTDPRLQRSTGRKIAGGERAHGVGYHRDR